MAIWFVSVAPASRRSNSVPGPMKRRHRLKKPYEMLVIAEGYQTAKGCAPEAGLLAHRVSSQTHAITYCGPEGWRSSRSAADRAESGRSGLFSGPGPSGSGLFDSYHL